MADEHLGYGLVSLGPSVSFCGECTLSNACVALEDKIVRLSYASRSRTAMTLNEARLLKTAV